jgi:hypothetical protein
MTMIKERERDREKERSREREIEKREDKIYKEREGQTQSKEKSLHIFETFSLKKLPPKIIDEKVSEMMFYYKP